MRILYLANNRVGYQVLSWLKEQGEEVVGLVIHPEGRQKFAREILEAAALPPDKVYYGTQLNEPDTLRSLRGLRADIALSVFFGYLLRGEILKLFSHGVINLHPAYLPYNRGAYPNIWSIVEGTPVGATLHSVDEGVDTGDIIARKEVSVTPVDTGETLYRKLEEASVDLFRETWPFIRTGKAPRIPQDESAGTYHLTRDVENLDQIDLEATYRARDLINLLRARTFPPYRGAYFTVGEGRRIYLRLQLIPEEEMEK
ncbi:methionyl-tRNA formyltransferase [Chloroflexota bacterium]